MRSVLFSLIAPVLLTIPFVVDAGLEIGGDLTTVVVCASDYTPPKNVSSGGLSMVPQVCESSIPSGYKATDTGSPRTIGGYTHTQYNVALVNQNLAESTEVSDSQVYDDTDLVPAGKGGKYEASGYGTCEFVELINNVIGFVLWFASIAATIVFIYAGFKLVTSGGDVSAKTNAKSLLVNVLIGYVIVLAAFLIVNLVLGVLLKSDNAALNWQKIECIYAKTPAERSDGYKDYEAEFDPDAFYDYGGEGELILTAAEQTSGVSGGTGSDSVGAGSGSGGVGVGSGSGGTGVSSGGGLTGVVACNTGNMRTVGFLGHKVTVNAGLVPSLQRINKRWRAQGSSRYKIRSMGSYNCRNIAGTSKRSVHSYGLAIDINSAQNPHCPHSGKCKGKNVLITDMPASFVNLFKSEGWGWGGNWNSSKDAMHFSKARNEGGNMKGG